MSNPDQEYKRGLKALKTGFFKWKPDYVQASICFESAAKGYERNRQIKNAIEAYQHLADCQEKLSEQILFSVWACGRSYEILAQLFLMDSNTDQAAQCVDKAGNFFRINNTSDKAMRLYIENGRIMQDRGLIELAARFYAQGLHIVTEDQLYQYSRDAVSPYVSLLLDNGLYYDAYVVYEKELKMAQELQRPHYVNKAALCIIGAKFLLDKGQAEEKLQDLCGSISGFVMTSEYAAGMDMIQAYNKGNPEEFQSVIRRPAWTNTEPGVNFTQLLRALRKIEIAEAGGANDLDFR